MSTTSNDALSWCGQRLRADDPDRYFCTLFAPPDKREALFALYLFDLELDRVPASTSEPALGEIRLQWWKEALSNPGDTAAGHPVVQALGRIHSGLQGDLLDAMIDARIDELSGEAPQSLAELVDHVSGISGTLIRQAVGILIPDGEDAGEVARDAGVAILLARMLRARRHTGFPRDLLAALHLEPDDFRCGRHDRRTARAVHDVVDCARHHLGEARRNRRLVPAGALSALLPLGFASYDLSTLQHNDYNMFDENFQRRTSGRQLSVLARALLRRY